MKFCYFQKYGSSNVNICLVRSVQIKWLTTRYSPVWLDSTVHKPCSELCLMLSATVVLMCERPDGLFTKIKLPGPTHLSSWCFLLHDCNMVNTNYLLVKVIFLHSTIWCIMISKNFSSSTNGRYKVCLQTWKPFIYFVTKINVILPNEKKSTTTFRNIYLTLK